MQRRTYLSTLGVAGVGALTGCTALSSRLFGRPANPNVIVILTDDMGYGDLGCFGSPHDVTPELDQMAADGLQLTSWYGAPVCVPSRTGLLTGRYPRRAAFNPGGTGPSGTGGLHPAEITIADLLGTAGYSSACIGKWHLGHQPRDVYLPTNQGFEYYFGIPYSNSYSPEWKAKYPPLPLIRGTETIEQSIDQDTMTKRFTDEAIAFIERQVRQDTPFFCYLAHPMPHAPFHVTDHFRGMTGLGLYWDVIRSLSFHTGRLLERLRELEIAEETLTIFTSDNGPWKPGPGRNGPFRGWKGQVLEGGMREPTIAHWPEHIPAGTTSAALTSELDILPTVAGLTGTSVPSPRVIDGHDLGPFLRDPTSQTPPSDEFAYTRAGHAWGFLAIRRDNWKLHVTPSTDGRFDPQALYDLSRDPAEQHDRSSDHPELVADLHARLIRLNDRLAGAAGFLS